MNELNITSSNRELEKLINSRIHISDIVNMSTKELETLVRQRLGQKDAVLCKSLQDHLRFNFHTADQNGIDEIEFRKNQQIMSLFDDIFSQLDIPTPYFMSAKGNAAFTLKKITWYDKDFNRFEILNVGGYGTVDAIVSIIKLAIEDQSKFIY